MRVRSVMAVALFLQNVGCSDSKKESGLLSDSKQNVSSLCKGKATPTEQLQLITDYLVIATSNENDPQFPALFDHIMGDSQDFPESGFSFEDCKVAADGSLSFVVINQKKESMAFEFDAHGDRLIKFEFGQTRLGSEIEALCMRDTLTFYVLKLTSDFAQYENIPAPSDFSLNFSETKGAEIFVDAECRQPIKELRFAKNSSSIPIYYRVPEDAEGTLRFKIDELGYGDAKRVFGPAKIQSPDLPVQDESEGINSPVSESMSDLPSMPEVTEPLRNDSDAISISPSSDSTPKLPDVQESTQPIQDGNDAVVNSPSSESVLDPLILPEDE